MSVLERVHDPEVGQSQHRPTFYESYKPQLGLLFEIFGLPQDALETLPSTVTATQPWALKEHTDWDERTLAPEQSSAARKLYHDFGLVDEIPLPAGDYDNIFVLGGMQQGNNRRLAFTRQSLQRGDVRTKHLTLLSGQRPVNPSIEKGLIAENMTRLAHNGTQDPWVEKILADPAGLKWETNLLRLAAADHLGPMTLKQLHLRLGNEDPVSRFELDWNGIPTTLVHSLAVYRPGGEPRPTTVSSLKYVLTTTPPEKGARSAFIAGNPHVERMSRDARVLLKNMQREDIELIGAGPAAIPNQDHQIYLGEVARNLYIDLQATA
jgi:hypothetical protein